MRPDREPTRQERRNDGLWALAATAAIVGSVIADRSLNSPSQIDVQELQILPEYEAMMRNIRDPLIDNHEVPTENEKSINYKTTDFSEDSDEILLARMIFGEARSCSYMERLAVGFSAVNRVNDGKKWNGETLSEVLLKPWQYSCFNDGDPNRVKLMDPKSYDTNSFYECLNVAGDILSGKITDPTNGATHYFNPDYANPSWADKLERIGRIETENGLSKHEFYREN